MNSTEYKRQLEHRKRFLKDALTLVTTHDETCDGAASEARRAIRVSIEDLTPASLRKVLRTVLREYPA